MTDAIYAPGAATLVCVPGLAVLIDLSVNDPLVTRVYQVAQASADIDDVLDVLVSPGLKAVRSFALATRVGEECRIIVRGSFCAEGPDGPLTPSGVLSDISFSRPGPLSLFAGESEGPWLSLAHGVVSAAAVQILDSDTWNPAHAIAPASMQSAPARSAAGAPAPRHAIVSVDFTSPIRPAGAVAPPPMVQPVPLAAQVTPPPSRTAPPPNRTAPLPDRPAPPPDHPAPPMVRLNPALMPPVPTRPAPDDSQRAPVSIDRVPAQFEVAPVAEEQSAPAPRSAVIQAVPWAIAGPAPEPTPEPVASPPGVDPERLEMTVDRRTLSPRSSRPETMVVAVTCPDGHLTPAYVGTCRTCGKPIPPQEPHVTERPSLGVLRLSNGDSVVLDRGAILGRSPHPPNDGASEQPNLVRLDDPTKGISSQHCEVSLDFWHVLVTDLGSTNGTEVILPGQAPIRLTPHDAMTIEPGTKVVLAEIQDFVFEVT
ncbi:MAG: FHA domain-containing protein [Propionibacteriaceae bacterium]|nr:FHA domain-containing protein [Propionibacteriaceae bacterium]